MAAGHPCGRVSPQGMTGMAAPWGLAGSHVTWDVCGFLTSVGFFLSLSPFIQGVTACASRLAP